MFYRSIAVACCDFQETFLSCTFCFCYFRPRDVHLGSLLLFFVVKRTCARAKDYSQGSITWCEMEKKSVHAKKGLFFIVISALISINERN